MRDVARIAWARRKSWAPPLAFAATIASITAVPASIVPIARGYATLCERYPELALLTNHTPPLPLALVFCLVIISLALGLRAGSIVLLASVRFNRHLHSCAAPAPYRVESMADELGLAERVTYVAWAEPLACCYGFFRPRIAVTAGLVDRLDDEELVAVLGHEREHLRRRDPLRYLLLDALTAAAFMLPVVPVLRQRWHTRTELAADRAALAVATRGALAGALLAVIRSPETPPGVAGMTSTEARIAQLGGESVLPPIPAREVLISVALAAVVIVATIVLAKAADLVGMTCPFCPWFT